MTLRTYAPRRVRKTFPDWFGRRIQSYTRTHAYINEPAFLRTKKDTFLSSKSFILFACSLYSRNTMHACSQCLSDGWKGKQHTKNTIGTSNIGICIDLPSTWTCQTKEAQPAMVLLHPDRGCLCSRTRCSEPIYFYTRQNEIIADASISSVEIYWYMQLRFLPTPLGNGSPPTMRKEWTQHYPMTRIYSNTSASLKRGRIYRADERYNKQERENKRKQGSRFSWSFSAGM